MHGHLHGTAARTLAGHSRRHLNVNCELTGYHPMRLAELATTARALLAGDVEPRRTTAHMLAKVLGRATPDYVLVELQ